MSHFWHNSTQGYGTTPILSILYRYPCSIAPHGRTFPQLTCTGLESELLPITPYFDILKRSSPLGRTKFLFKGDYESPPHSPGSIPPHDVSPSTEGFLLRGFENLWTPNSTSSTQRYTGIPPDPSGPLTINFNTCLYRLSVYPLNRSTKRSSCLTPGSTSVGRWSNEHPTLSGNVS